MLQKLAIAIVTISLLVLSVSCISPLTSPTPTVTLSQYELEYRLFDKYPDYFWCDPHLWPIVREGEEEKDSLIEFPAIRANSAEFSAILTCLGLPDKADYSGAEILSIYREHKKLNRAIQMTANGNNYKFTLAIGEGQGFRIEGTITPTGFIRETKRESSINTCPICLVKDTLIDTPNGQIPVEKISPGMPVWSLDSKGQRTSEIVIAASSAAVPLNFQVVKITLDDGRAVTASPGHPSATGKFLGDYERGDTLDGAVVSGIEHLDYMNGQTFDILPSGETGLYWANGILLKSTLK